MVWSNAAVGIGGRGCHYVSFSKCLQVVCPKISMHLVVSVGPRNVKTSINVIRHCYNVFTTNVKTF